MAERNPAKPTSGRRWRRVLPVLLTLVVLGGLLWGADAAVRTAAESLLARNVQDSTGAADLPAVHVRGSWFLPQVIRGAYGEVDLTIMGVTSGELHVQRVDSSLYEFRLPFHDVLVRDVRGVAVGRSVQHVRLTYADLNSYFQATGRPLKLSAADNGQIRVEGSVDVLSAHLSVVADVVIAVIGGKLTVTPVKIDTGGATLGGATRLLLNQRLTLTIPMDALPFGHELTQVTPNGDGLEVVAQGTNIVIHR